MRLALIALCSLAATAYAEQLRVDLATRTASPSRAPLRRACDTTSSPWPAAVEIDLGSISISARGRRVRHALGRRDGLSWATRVGGRVIVGFATHTKDRADAIAAFDLATGARAWQHAIDSQFGAEFTGDFVAVERERSLAVIDARTGKIVATTPIDGHVIRAVCRGASAIYVKTHGDVVALDRATGAIRWTQPTTGHGGLAILDGAIVDGWVDKTTHRFGVVSYEPASGRRLDSIDLGATGGWYDFESLEVTADGPHDVLVVPGFGVE